MPEPASGAKRLTPEQEQALEESIACALALEPPAPPPEGPPPGWPRDRGGLCDEVLRERSRGRWSGRSLVTFDSNVLVCTAQVGDPRRIAAPGLPRVAARGPRVLTVQALGEFFFAATRKRLLPPRSPPRRCGGG